MKRNGILTATLVALMAGMAFGVVGLDTIQIQEGLVVAGSTYDGTSTLWIRGDAGDGIVNTMMRVGFQGTGVRRGLMRFGQLSHWAGVDLGFDAADIVSATLTLTTDTAFEGAGTCELRVVGPDDGEWQPGFTTWLKERTDVPLDWESGPGVGTNYSAVIDTVVWTNPGGNSGPTVTPMTFDLTGAALDAVQDWVSGDDTGAGFIFRAEAESGATDAYLDFYSDLHGTQSYRPLLEITYIPEPVSLVVLGLGGLALWRRRG